MTTTSQTTRRGSARGVAWIWAAVESVDYLEDFEP
jgi:hypothetical protein